MSYNPTPSTKGFQYYSARHANGTVSSSATINWANGNTQSLAITQTTTLTFSNTNAGGRYLLEVQQDETGSRAITWPSTLVWAGGSAPTASGALKVDIFTFYNNGTSTFGGSNLNY